MLLIDDPLETVASIMFATPDAIDIGSLYKKYFGSNMPMDDLREACPVMVVNLVALSEYS